MTGLKLGLGLGLVESGGGALTPIVSMNFANGIYMLEGATVTQGDLVNLNGASITANGIDCVGLSDSPYFTATVLALLQDYGASGFSLIYTLKDVTLGNPTGLFEFGNNADLSLATEVVYGSFSGGGSTIGVAGFITMQPNTGQTANGLATPGLTKIGINIARNTGSGYETSACIDGGVVKTDDDTASVAAAFPSGISKFNIAGGPNTGGFIEANLYSLEVYSALTPAQLQALTA